MALWLGVLFTTIGIAASDFFSVNLSTISNVLGLSESLAGVTFLAFGNGSPDVFSTFAAMQSHSGSLAIGELIGAASFITAVVAGSMAIVQPFKVTSNTFVRDVGFFVVAVSFSMGFLADGRLRIWECIVMVGYYVFYVAFVVFWHWWVGRRNRRRERNSESRSHFLGAGEEEEDDERHDSADGNLAQGERQALLRVGSGDDARALDYARVNPRIRLANEDDEEDADMMLAEVNSNMRLTRPSGGERRQSVNPIRPSLVGALEFRAVLSSLQKSQNMQTIPLFVRRYSYGESVDERQQDSRSFVSDPEVHSQAGMRTEERHRDNPSKTAGPRDAAESRTAGLRTRAVSTNDAIGLHLNPRLSQSLHERLPRSSHSPDHRLLGPHSPSVSGRSSPSISLSPPGSERGSRATSPVPAAPRPASLDFLAPPKGTAFKSLPRQISRADSRPNSTETTSDVSKSLQLPKIVIPEISNEPSNSGSDFPFPTAPEYASPASLEGQPRLHDISLLRRDSGYSLPGGGINDGMESKPISWWPYRLLPPPQVMVSTLFPTLYSWKHKSAWERILGLIAAPSVFLLTITLPVVEWSGDVDVAQMGKASDLPQAAVDTTGSGNKVLGAAEEAWGVFQTPLQKHDVPGNGIDPPTISDSNANSSSVGAGRSTSGHSKPFSSAPEAPYSVSQTSSPVQVAGPRGWNRWLVCLQIITAPLFVVLLVWANKLSDSPETPPLLLPILYSLVGSMIVLAVFVAFTDPAKPPRRHFLLCFAGFVVSIAWISTIANEVVGVLKAFGVILGISDAILGLTIFAVGNSLGDLVADITVARLGYQVMALSACFGGPMLNILLGIGLSGLYMTISKGENWHKKHPHKHLVYKPYQIEVSNTLMITGATLLVTLIGLLVLVPLNGWRMDRRIGWGLVALWIVSTVSNVAVEISGWGGSTSL